jgi:hypothetical protein
MGEISDLPDEVLSLILNLLPQPDLCDAALVEKRWEKLARHTETWKLRKVHDWDSLMKLKNPFWAIYYLLRRLDLVVGELYQ